MIRLVIVLGVWAGVAWAEPPPLCRSGVCAGSTCLAKISDAATTVPPDACPFEGESQTDADIFSWNTFIAINWPADEATCAADKRASIQSGKSPTVWESWAEDSGVFVAPPAKPAPFCEGKTQRLQRAPAKVRALAEKSGVHRVLHRRSKSKLDSLGDIGQAVGGVLTDQNGRFVRYEIHVNADEYDYLVKNELWSYDGQAKAKKIEFPVKPTGAVEVKAAWKILTNAEVKSGRFYTTRAIVYNDKDETPSPGENPVTLGLVGMHIVHKTAKQKSWFWSTFEHVDNTTTSFFDAKCKTCAPNKQTANADHLVELDAKGKPINKPVQVVRTNAIQASPALNEYYRGLLKGSVWENYQLISTQWTTPHFPDGEPKVLANAVMETFIQQKSSCISCHQMAVTRGSSIDADFSFLLMDAKKPAKSN
jgi:hypothetical protein